MPRKIILDVDPGVDDAVAMTMALFDPRLDVLAVTAVAGNVSAAQATRNVYAILEQLDPPRWPRVGAATDPDEGLPANALHIFGSDGLGNTHFPVAEPHHVHSSEKVISDLLRTHPEEITILALGPLTNLARVFQREPGLIGLVGQIVIMGGAVAVGGNVTPAAEFNIYCDPQAARRVFRTPVTKTLVPLDVSQQLVFGYSLLEELPEEETRAGHLLRTILPFTFRSHHERLGIEGIHLHDPVALVAATHPELFSIRALAGDVETSGELTVGATLFDRRPLPDQRPNIHVALESDTVAVNDAILRGLRQAGQSG